MAATSPLHQTLRDSTREAHDAIEGNERLKRVMSSDLSEHEYRELLASYYGFYAPIETRLASHPDWLLGEARARFRAPRLAADLRALGLSLDEIEALPRCDFVPAVETLSQAAGVLYVAEGSVLGGRLMAKHLEQFSYINAETSSFFAVEPSEAAAGWKRFLAALATADVDSATAVESASETFRAMDQWMAAGSGLRTLSTGPTV